MYVTLLPDGIVALQRTAGLCQKQKVHVLAAQPSTSLLGTLVNAFCEGVAPCASRSVGEVRHAAFRMSAAFSAIMMVGALVLPPMSVGMTDASTT